MAKRLIITTKGRPADHTLGELSAGLPLVEITLDNSNETAEGRFGLALFANRGFETLVVPSEAWMDYISSKMSRSVYQFIGNS